MGLKYFSIDFKTKTFVIFINKKYGIQQSHRKRYK